MTHLPASHPPDAPPSNTKRSVPPPRSTHRLPVGDVVLVAGTFAASVLFATLDLDGEVPAVGASPTLVALALFAVASAALVRRRREPLLVLGTILVVSALATALDQFDGPLMPTMFALYGVGRRVADERWSMAGLGCVAVLIAAGDLQALVPTIDSGMGVLIAAAIWYIGRRLRLREDAARVRAAQLEIERSAESRRAVAEERTRIARELHDVVAHQVSLMTVQASAARTVAGADPAGALRAMASVEAAGRQALEELRHLMGVLRPDGETGLGPQPGLADVPRLVERLVAAGPEVSLVLDDVPEAVAARTALSAYRIVQEALTNVLKHVGPDARIEVRIAQSRRDADALVIEVSDRGGSATPLPGTGHGIVGMRERAQLLGGTLEAGPVPGGGFRVVARLPLGRAS